MVSLEVSSLDLSRSFVAIIHHLSRCNHSYTMKHKSETFKIFQIILVQVEQHFETNLKYLKIINRSIKSAKELTGVDTDNRAE